MAMFVLPAPVGAQTYMQTEQLRCPGINGGESRFTIESETKKKTSSSTSNEKLRPTVNKGSFMYNRS